MRESGTILRRRAATEEEPSAMAADRAFDQRIGAMARLLRSQRGWSIQELSSRCGLSTGMISQIERGLSTPSLRSLRVLAAALEVPVGQFFENGERGGAGAAAYVVRRASRRVMNLNNRGVTKAFLMPPGAGLLDMWEFRIAPGGSSGGDLAQHEGEKAGVVLEGRLQLWLDGAPLELEAGDSFRFSGLQPHRVDNPYAMEAAAIWIIVPARDSAGGKAAL
ncbi:cupin domain-containing protein [Roseomonas sp. E05]|uniref:helix-turn-helix domain-containing protein n=1 Tax=Roseomonas sp. E05 TaxID=3046310 RepID=UPI0024BAA09B|nr:cupin domain-containing protein [Roseomonas sp. E05]MDJ0388773.1 cupin domain-containing protein [Roseomonas sp. E05]